MGPVLDLPPPALPPEGVLFPFPALVLAATLADPGDAGLVQKAGDILSRRSPFSFSAAAAANMILEPLSTAALCGDEFRRPEPDGGYSFTWKIGETRWLPAVKRRREGGVRE
jgi:hypothetical protein